MALIYPRLLRVLILVTTYISELNGFDKAGLIQQGKSTGVKNNSYLDEFLKVHSQPVVRLRRSKFTLNIDRRHEFAPPIRAAPLSSVGEPWPLPKYYKSEKETLLHLKRSTFNISVLKKSCDILTRAIKRYKNIIEKHIPEEHYEFVYNFDESLYNRQKIKEESKFNHVTTMVNLEIIVMEEDCGYPHIDMNESYKLMVTPNLTQLIAKQVWGALRGLETFSQLLFRRRNTDSIYAMVTQIEDEPRFPHRGILLDTARHFILKQTIKDVMDGMTYNKLNVLHWHIVDDNSFPYQSKVFPDLSKKAAFHPKLVYTHEDIKEIVQYARLRGIRVIPEFDTPGHTFTWFGYPEIKSTCYSNQQLVPGPLGPIDPTKNETYLFLAKLFSEIYQVFPETFVHLGGDELHNICWATNPKIKAFFKGQAGFNISDTKHLTFVIKVVGYYFARLIPILQKTAFANKQKKSFVMWEDVLKDTSQVPIDSILQVWTTPSSKVKALNDRGYRALYSACWYLDNYQTDPQWPDYYACEPSPYEQEEEEKGKLLGGEACLWAEYITTDTLMTFMWPRACAPAERLWSPKTTRDMTSAQRRYQEQRCRMIYRGLQTGHSSGPDYCLRPKNGPVGRAKKAPTDLQDSSVVRYMPLANITLTMVGMYFIISAANLWKKKRKKISSCQKA